MWFKFIKNNKFEIIFDRNPTNQTFNYEGKTLNLIQYYEKVYQIKIKNKDQPLILVRKKDAQGNPLNLYFVPELCNLVGIDEDDIVNNKFMKEVSQCTQMEPDEKVAKINDFMNLLLNKDEDNLTPEKWSSKKKYEYYGINIIPPKIVALLLSLSPIFLPIITPTMQIIKVITPIIIHPIIASKYE